MPYLAWISLNNTLKFPPIPPNDDLDDENFTTFAVPGVDDDLIAEHRREGRKFDADEFRRQYSYGSSLEQKTFIWPGGTHLWKDKSSGIIWVGVHGMDSICVVTRAGDLDVTRVHRYLKYLTKEALLLEFRKTVISEIEDLASPSSKLRKSFGQSIPKPFSVVSVIRGTDNVHTESGHEASSDEYEEDEEVESSQCFCLLARLRMSLLKCFLFSDEYESNEKKMARLRKNLLKDEKREREREQNEGQEVAGYDETKTVKFLREQLMRDRTTIQVSSTEFDETAAIKFLLEKMTMMGMEAFTVDETIKTAISAFQHLFQKKFKANEIEVTVMDPHYFVSKEEVDYKDLYVKELEMRDIEDHLAAINVPGSVV